MSGTMISTAPVDETTLLLPEHDVEDPEVSIVIPALNEELTIEMFMKWCWEGLAAAGAVGEVLIIDSGSDRTTERALALGARVLRTPKRGLGRAYIDAVPFIRGKYVVMGDADCTYDFRRLAPFVEGFREGNEFLMGSRWKGSIEDGSMPGLHRYFGTPLTTWILNRVYSSHFSDIHCGMRGLTLDALKRMNIESQSWEYASEMVLKSVHMELKTVEVPVTFLKDQDGRVSHHRRSGWWSPWAAAWINLRAMFVYGADFFVLRPGFVAFALGVLLTLPLSFGSISIGGLELSLYWQLLGMTLTIVGTQGVLLGWLAQMFFDYTGKRSAKIMRRFRYTRAVVLGWALMLLGGIALIPMVVRYFSNDLSFPGGLTWHNHLGVTGLATSVVGFSVFVFTLVINAAGLESRHVR